MKKLLSLAAMALFFASCQSQKNEDHTVTTADTTMSTPAETTTTTTYTQYRDGDVKMVERKVMVYRNGNWVVADSDVTMTNGAVVKVNGDVVKDGKTRKLEEGEVVNTSGDFFDRTGNALSNAWEDTKEGAADAWDATKEGAKDAGQAIKKGANKVGEKTKEVVNDIKD
ncbi:MAG: hypothetical protein EOO01_23135 [Chitinophagaceae bacterium]|nr:MAG: hypothetical protein EOO01_23135 [Chitinophagaceae bacterium]